MRNAPLTSQAQDYLSLVLFLLCFSFLPNTQFGQSLSDLYPSYGDDEFPFYKNDDLIFPDDILFVRGNGSEYLMVMDTLKFYSLIDGELQVSRIEIFGYDEEFRYNKQEVWSMSPVSGELVPSSRILIEYNEFGLIASDTFFFYNSQLNSWVYNHYREIEHEGNLQRGTRYNWVLANSRWQVFSITENEFENDIFIKRSTYFWRDHLQDFRLEDILERDYDETLFKYQRNYRYDIQLDSFFLYELQERLFNDNDLVEIIDVSRVPIDGGFGLKPLSRREFRYNALNQLTETIDYEPYNIVLFGSEIIASKKDNGAFKFHIIGEKPTTIASDSLFGWDPVSRVVWTYDQYGDLLIFERYEISEEDPEDWKGTRRTEFERDYDYSMGTFVPYVLFNNDQHMLLREIDYDSPSDNIIQKREHIYSQVIVNTKEIDPDNPLTVFPNPTKDVIHIELDQQISNTWSIQVIDMLGRLWHSGKFNSPMEVNTQEWPTGIYNVVLSDKERGSVVTRQVVKF